MYAVQVRSSMYSQEPRMSITDSCKQYQKFLRQERGLEAKSGIYYWFDFVLSQIIKQKAKNVYFFIFMFHLRTKNYYFYF